MRRLARMLGSAAGVACLVASLAAPCMAATTPAAGKPDLERCRAVDACYDAIRRNPSDPSLLSALGDALLRANRPADALRTYQRVLALAPNTPGVAAKISAVEAKLSAKRPSGNPSTRTVVADAASGKRYSNAAPETQSH
jgi:cytochrome c-type biogenesis protein CcmH/NrfG